MIERLIAIAARRHDFDQVELRRRNLVPVSAMPYANPLGLTYDSGAYEQAMDQALALADWQRIRAAPQAGCAAWAPARHWDCQLRRGNKRQCRASGRKFLSTRMAASTS